MDADRIAVHHFGRFVVEQCCGAGRAFGNQVQRERHTLGGHLFPVVEQYSFSEVELPRRFVDLPPAGGEARHEGEARVRTDKGLGHNCFLSDEGAPIVPVPGIDR